MNRHAKRSHLDLVDISDTDSSVARLSGDEGNIIKYANLNGSFSGGSADVPASRASPRPVRKTNSNSNPDTNSSQESVQSLSQQCAGSPANTSTPDLKDAAAAGTPSSSAPSSTPGQHPRLTPQTSHRASSRESPTPAGISGKQESPRLNGSRSKEPSVPPGGGRSKESSPLFKHQDVGSNSTSENEYNTSQESLRFRIVEDLAEEALEDCDPARQIANHQPVCIWPHDGADNIGDVKLHIPMMSDRHSDSEFTIPINRSGEFTPGQLRPNRQSEPILVGAGSIECDGVADRDSMRLDPPTDFLETLASSPDSISDKSTEILAKSLRNGQLEPPRGMTPNDSSSNSLNSMAKTSNRVGDKKKGKTWYNALSPNYKSRCDEFKRYFKVIPSDERLIVDYSCALQKETGILTHGRLYVTQNWICFYASIFRWETVLTIRCKDIAAMTKEKTARVIPNAVQILTNSNEKYFFTSFGARDKTFLMLFRVWQNALLDQPMSPQELWQWVHYSYGQELGLNSSDEEGYVGPGEDEAPPKIALDLTDDKSPDDGIQDDYKDASTYPVGYSGSDKESGAGRGTDDPNLTTSTEEVFPLMEQPTKKRSAALLLEAVPDDADVPTDDSDTTEDDEELACGCHEHIGMEVLNDIFHISADTMFENLFTDSKFMNDFMTKRKTTDRVSGQWSDEGDQEGAKYRELNYTLSISSQGVSASFGPKTAETTEKQCMLGRSKPGSVYVIDCEVFHHNIPYADTFYVINRYCVTKVTNCKCRLRITSEVRYRKSCWGLVKNLIDKTATSGLYDNFNDLAIELQKSTEKVAEIVLGATGHGPRRQKVLRRRRLVSKDSVPTAVPSAVRTQEPAHVGAQGSPVKGKGLSRGLSSSSRPRRSGRTHISSAKGTQVKEEWELKLDADIMVKIVCIVLILLVMFNALLFYKLWSLESMAGNVYSLPLDQAAKNMGGLPANQEEWVKVIKHQQNLHKEELERWKDVLDSSIQIMDQMKLTLVELKKSIDQRPYFNTDNTDKS